MIEPAPYVASSVLQVFGQGVRACFNKRDLVVGGRQPVGELDSDPSRSDNYDPLGPTHKRLSDLLCIVEGGEGYLTKG